MAGENEKEMEDNPRAALEAAFEQHSSTGEEEQEEQEDSDDVGSEEEREEEEEDEEGSEVEEDEKDEEGEDSSGEDSGSQKKDGAGEDEGGEDEDEDKSASSGSGDDSDGGDTGRAPVSWSPKVREHWGKLPKEVQQEISKREREITQTLGQTTAARRFAQEWTEMIRPYEHLMAMQNATPYQAVKQLLNIGAGLVMGSQQQKAQIISNLVNQYQIDIETLDSALAGTSQQNPEMERIIQERLRPFQEFMSREQQQRQQQLQQTQSEVISELETFKNSKEAEFFEDVRMDMADLLDLAHRRGKSLSIKDAYAQACKLNPEIASILEGRKRAAAAKRGREEIGKKKKAASSIRGKKGSGGEEVVDTDNTRSAIEQAWALVESRGRRRV